MEKVLYRKYRSESLDDIVGQDHITRTLKNALKAKNISHAYLFTGPRGVGKTSVARILAHAVNDLKYDKDTTHLDIIEIDAASNRRIDEIRDLRDKVHIAPTSARYKVYIIDEVHMLTKEAFNALLKTLEEPPEHVIFILATTEFHKLPETIVSRTQHFSFKSIQSEDAVSHLVSIAKQEGATLSNEAAELIAEQAGGSFRDSISMLDKLKSYDSNITIDTAKLLLGIAPAALIDDLLTETMQGTPKSLLTALERAYLEGYDGGSLATQLSKKIRQRIITQADSSALLALYKRLNTIAASNDFNTSLEIALLDTQNSNKGVVVSLPTEEADTEKPSAQTIAPPEEIATHPATTVEAKTATANEDELWTALTQEIKNHHNTLYGVIRMADAEVSSETLHLTFRFSFHLKQINEPKNIQLISELANKLSGKQISVVCQLAEKPAVAMKPKKQNNKNIETINNIFGQSEVLESE